MYLNNNNFYCKKNRPNVKAENHAKLHLLTKSNKYKKNNPIPNPNQTKKKKKYKNLKCLTTAPGLEGQEIRRPKYSKANTKSPNPKWNHHKKVRTKTIIKKTKHHALSQKLNKFLEMRLKKEAAPKKLSNSLRNLHHKKATKNRAIKARTTTTITTKFQLQHFQELQVKSVKQDFNVSLSPDNQFNRSKDSNKSRR